MPIPLVQCLQAFGQLEQLPEGDWIKQDRSEEAVRTSQDRWQLWSGPERLAVQLKRFSIHQGRENFHQRRLGSKLPSYSDFTSKNDTPRRVVWDFTSHNRTRHQTHTSRRKNHITRPYITGHYMTIHHKTKRQITLHHITRHHITIHPKIHTCKESGDYDEEKGSGEWGKCWQREAVARGSGRLGQWSTKGVVTPGKWWRQGSGEKGKWWPREVMT